MKVTIIIILTLVLIAAITPFTAKLWPRSYTQDLVMLWLNEGDWIHLLALAEKTPYTHITWAESKLTRVGTRTNESIRWVEEPEISELVSAAREYGIYFFELYYYRGDWAIIGFSDAWVKISNQAEVVDVTSYYQYGGELVGKECSMEIIEAESSGRCHVALFGDWVLYKEWFTTQNPSYGAND